MSTTVQHAVSEYFAAIRAMDVERWIHTFAPDAVSHDPVGSPAMHGHEALRRFFNQVTAGFDTVGLKENSVFINGYSAAVKWTGEGVGKNGKAIRFEGIDVIHCNEHGKITSVHAYWDPAPMMGLLMS
jgi:steroid Delta-isomerase